MAKIPFDIKYRPQIESGEYKVETKDGRPVKIISFEMTDTNDCPIAAQFRLCAGTPVVYLFDKGGHYKAEGDSDYDLFLVTPEPELTDFEKAVNDFLNYWNGSKCDRSDNPELKKKAAELLALAKSHLLQSGELMTQEQHEKLVETQYKETLDGVKKNWHDYFTPQAVTDIYNAGRNDVLKDLPRWKKHEEASDKLATVWNDFVTPWLDWRGHRIAVRDLEKLPGFKEEEK